MQTLDQQGLPEQRDQLGRAEQTQGLREQRDQQVQAEQIRDQQVQRGQLDQQVHTLDQQGLPEPPALQDQQGLLAWARDQLEQLGRPARQV